MDEKIVGRPEGEEKEREREMCNFGDRKRRGKVRMGEGDEVSRETNMGYRKGAN